jgi:hypothetical protein
MGEWMAERRSSLALKLIMGGAVGVLSLVVLYALAAVIVFDFSQPALPYDEENYQQRSVAIGPRPRRAICPPTWYGYYYEGREWPFLVFAPVCRIWQESKGYAPSAEWR